MVVNPADFQAQALTWIGVIVVVAGALTAAIAKVMGEVKQLIAVAKAHSDDIRSLGEQVTATALATPSPAPATGTQTDSVTVSQTTTPGG